MVADQEADRAFAQFVSARDPEALAFVFERTAPALLRAARSLLGEARAAEDVVQDLFLSLLANGRGYDAARPCMPYLLGVLHHRAAKWRERAARRPAVPLPTSLPDRDGAGGLPGAAELGALLGAAIDHLPDSSRDVVRGYVLDGESPAEIARRLHRRVGTVRVQLHRGLQRLRTLLPRTLAPLCLLSFAAGLRAQPGAQPGARPRALRRSTGWTIAGAAAVVVLGLGALAAAWSSVPAREAVVGAPGASLRGGAGAAVAPATDAAGAAAHARVAVTAAAALAVRVVGPGGKVLPHVGVRAVAIGRDTDFASVHGLSDEAGAVLFTGLPPGGYEVECDRGSRLEAQVATGAPTEVVLAAEPGTLVRGTVRDRRGAPLPGAGVWLCQLPRHPWEGAVVAHADAQGAFALADVPAMSVVGALAAGHAPAPLQVVGPGPVRELDLVVGDAVAALRGDVRDRRGAPVAGAVVRVGQHARSGYVLPDGETLAMLLPTLVAVTGADGAFAFADLPTGPVEVCVRAPAHATALREVLLASGAPQQCSVSLAAGTEVRGRVLDEHEQPVAGAQVLAHGILRQAWAGVTTGADGRFRLQGLDPARVVLEVLADGFDPQQLACTGGTGDVTVQLAGGTQYRGRLVGDDGEPFAPAGAELGWRDEATPAGARASPQPVALGSGGTFAFVSTARLLRFFVRPDARSVWLPCACSGEPAACVVSVPPSPQQKAALRLRCRGLDQDQLADAFIVLRRDGELYRGVPEVEGGALALTDLPVGRYAAWLSGRTQRCPTLDLGEIDVGAGGADVDVEVPPLGRLRCELALADGRAPGRQRAFIRNAHGVEVPLHAASSELTLTAGAWRLFAGGIDFLPVRDLEFAVAPGATTALRVPLVPATVRHVAFWLPADVDRGRAAVAISMGERLIHEGDPGLDDHGFDATVDGFCSIVLPLAAGAHVLDLRDGGSRFRGEFVVGETDGRQEPIVVALRPVR